MSPACGSIRTPTPLAEVLPVAVMSLEILQRNLRTQELLGQTQTQASQLEAHWQEDFHFVERLTLGIEQESGIERCPALGRVENRSHLDRRGLRQGASCQSQAEGRPDEAECLERLDEQHASIRRTGELFDFGRLAGGIGPRQAR